MHVRRFAPTLQFEVAQCSVVVMPRNKDIKRNNAKSDCEIWTYQAKTSTCMLPMDRVTS